MRALASADDVLGALRAIRKDHTHPHFIHAFRYPADRGYGKPQARVDITSSGHSITEILHAARLLATARGDAESAT